MNAMLPGLGADRALFDLLFAELVAAGKGVMPLGRREDVIDLLTRLMIDAELFDAYTVELDTRRSQLGSEGELRLLRIPEMEIPGMKILQEGFGGLSDEQLADLATSPEALVALDRVYFRGTGEPGAWFYDAIDRASARQSDRDQRSRQASELTLRVSQQHSEATPVSPLQSQPHTAKRYRWLAYAVPTALAASLLLNVYLGWGPNRHSAEKKGPGPDPEEKWVASAIVEPSTVRGPNEEKRQQVRVTAPFDGFLVVVALAPDRKQKVYPGEGELDLRLESGKASEGLPLKADTTQILFVVTETPADDPIRRALEPKRFLANQESELRQELEKLLRDKGYRRVAIGTATVKNLP